MIRLHNPFSSLISSVLLTLLVGRWERNLSVCFNGHFPGGPGLAGTRMFPFWILLELRVIEVVVTTGAMSVKSPPPTNQHAVFLHASCPSCHPTNSIKALKGKDGKGMRPVKSSCASNLQSFFIGWISEHSLSPHQHGIGDESFQSITGMVLTT